MRTARSLERTHTQRARGADLKGNWTEPFERTDRVEWRTSRQRKGTPGQNSPHHALREVRGKEETKGGETQKSATPPLTCCEHPVQENRGLHLPRQ